MPQIVVEYLFYQIFNKILKEEFRFAGFLVTTHRKLMLVPASERRLEIHKRQMTGWMCWNPRP